MIDNQEEIGFAQKCRTNVSLIINITGLMNTRQINIHDNFLKTSCYLFIDVVGDSVPWVVIRQTGYADGKFFAHKCAYNEKRTRAVDLQGSRSNPFRYTLRCVCWSLKVNNYHLLMSIITVFISLDNQHLISPDIN